MASQDSSTSCVSKNEVSQVSSRVPMYQPSLWSHDFIESLETDIHIEDKDVEKKVIDLSFVFQNGCLSTLQLLELVDDIQQLGLGYRFKDNISEALQKIALINGNGDEEEEDSLHMISLKFRLLRQHGYNVSQDFVRRFKDSHGGFKEGLETDIKGLTSLYEASYLAFEGERDLHDAKLFATEHLLMTIKSEENKALKHVNHALELPLYRRCLRVHARWYIEAYGKRKDINLLLLEAATLDFNVVQSALKRELQQVSKWWKQIGLASELSFVRDRLMECFFWAVGMVVEPQHHSCRIWLTKVGTLITVIDDIYDLYASLDELEIFTDAVKRWDIDSTKHMPECLQLAFRALYNTIIELGSNTSITQRGEDIVPILVKVWGELLEAFLVEAKWTQNKHIPTLEKYLDNGWRSVSGVLILTHGYILINPDTNTDLVESLEKYNQLLKWSSMLFRLYNDLGSSCDEIKRGKTANAVSCYMHEKDVCEDAAREYIKTRVDQAWSELISIRVAGSQDSPDPLIDMAINLARMSQWTYQYGDGHGAPDERVREEVLSVLIEPIQI